MSAARHAGMSAFFRTGRTMNGQAAILIVAHGSPREESNADLLRVADSLRHGGEWKHVETAFLECNEPDVGEGFRRCVAAGAPRVVVVPYFLHTGKHVALDLPRLLADASAKEPRVEVMVAPYLGMSPE